jgi:hypothetical protein
MSLIDRMVVPAVWLVGLATGWQLHRIWLHFFA